MTIKFATYTIEVDLGESKRQAHEKATGSESDKLVEEFLDEINEIVQDQLDSIKSDLEAKGYTVDLDY